MKNIFREHFGIIVMAIVLLFLFSVFWMYISGRLFAAGQETQDAFAPVYKGDSKNYRFTIKNIYDYDAVDLTSYIIKFRVKKNPSDTTYSIDKTCTNSTPATGGLATVALSTSDTNIDAGDYYAYVILTNSGGSVYETLLKSKWKVTQ